MTPKSITQEARDWLEKMPYDCEGEGCTNPAHVSVLAFAASLEARYELVEKPCSFGCGRKGLHICYPNDVKKIEVVPSERIDWCCECKAEHGYDCPKDAPPLPIKECDGLCFQGSSMTSAYVHPGCPLHCPLPPASEEKYMVCRCKSWRKSCQHQGHRVPIDCDPDADGLPCKECPTPQEKPHECCWEVDEKWVGPCSWCKKEKPVACEHDYHCACGRPDGTCLAEVFKLQPLVPVEEVDLECGEINFARKLNEVIARLNLLANK